MQLEAVLTQAINRLEAVLAGETMALQSGDHAGLGDMAHRKNQSLLELSRIARGVEPHGMSETMRDRIGSLRSRLDDNRRLLEQHIEATSEVAGLIAQSIADADSDGTYAATQRGVAVR